MRVEHLNDSEIQTYIDNRCHARGFPLSPRIQDHLECCFSCRERMHEYSLLCGELAQCSQPDLPKDFARRVTLSLPLFSVANAASSRVRACLDTVVNWGLVSLVTVLWLFVTVDWHSLLGRLSLTLVSLYPMSTAWVSTAVSGVSIAEIALPDVEVLAFSAGWPVLESIGANLAANIGIASFLVFAATALLLAGSFDSLVLLRSRREETG